MMRLLAPIFNYLQIGLKADYSFPFYSASKSNGSLLNASSAFAWIAVEEGAAEISFCDSSANGQTQS